MTASEGKRPSTPHPEKGSALVMVIFVMVVLALLLAALAYINAQSNQNTALQIASTRAYWAAQSGAEWGVWQGENGSCAPSTPLTYSSYSPNAGLAGCQATVACLSSSTSSAFYYQINSTGVCTAGNLAIGNSPISATRSVVVGLATQNNCQGCTADCISNSCSPFFGLAICSRSNLDNCEKNNCSISPSNTNSCINTNCVKFSFDTWLCNTNGLGTCLSGYCPAGADGTAAATLSYWLESP